MASAAKKAGVHTMVAFNNLKTPAALVAKQIIDRGEIGEPIRFRGGSIKDFQRSLAALVMALLARACRKWSLG